MRPNDRVSPSLQPIRHSKDINKQIPPKRTVFESEALCVQYGAEAKVLASDYEDSKDINQNNTISYLRFYLTLIIRTLCVLDDFAIRVIRGKILAPADVCP